MFKIARTIKQIAINPHLWTLVTGDKQLGKLIYHTKICSQKEKVSLSLKLSVDSVTDTCQVLYRERRLEFKASGKHRFPLGFPASSFRQAAPIRLSERTWNLAGPWWGRSKFWELYQKGDLHVTRSVGLFGDTSREENQCSDQVSKERSTGAVNIEPKDSLKLQPIVEFRGDSASSLTIIGNF